MLRAVLRLTAALLILVDVALSVPRLFPSAEPYRIAWIDGNMNLYRSRPDGSHAQWLGRMPSTAPQLSWSPVGLQLAARLLPTGLDQVWLFDAMGGRTRPIALPVTPDAYHRHFSWSPDGNSLLVERGALAFDTQLYQVGIGRNVTPRLIDYRDTQSAAFTQDGAAIVFHSNMSGNYNIYRMQPDSTGRRALTESSETDNSPVPSPRADQLIYVSWSAGTSDMYLMNVDGSNTRRLTNDELFETGGIWSPDGTMLAYQAHSSQGAGGVWTLPISGGAPTLIAINSRLMGWSPDGEWLYLTRSPDAIVRLHPDGNGLQTVWQQNNTLRNTQVTLSPLMRSRWLPGLLTACVMLLYSHPLRLVKFRLKFGARKITPVKTVTSKGSNE
jgi:TolB protein